MEIPHFQHSAPSENNYRKNCKFLETEEIPVRVISINTGVK
jgi:hypothetical protein